MDEWLIVGIVAIAAMVVAMVYIFTKIVLFRKMLGTHYYRYGAHRIAVVITRRSLSLYIDGALADERKLLNVYVCTLSSRLGSVKIRARINGRLGRMGIDVTADDVPIAFERKEAR